MQSDLLVDAVLLTAVLEADLGSHRKVGTFRLLRPLGIAAVIIPLYLKPVVTHGHGLALEAGSAVAGIALGALAIGLMTIYLSPRTRKPATRTGFGYAALWVVVIGARAAFTYGSTHWFGSQLVHWQVSNGVSTAAITDALIFEAIAMILTRTTWMALRARHVAHEPGPRLAPEHQAT
jgi:hypothetical protein